MPTSKYLILNPSSVTQSILSEYKTLYLARDWEFHAIFDERGIVIDRDLSQSELLSIDENEALESTYESFLVFFDDFFLKRYGRPVQSKILVGPWLRLLIFHGYQNWKFVHRVKEKNYTPLINSAELPDTPTNTKDFIDSLFNGWFCDISIRLALDTTGIDYKCVNHPENHDKIKRPARGSYKLNVLCLIQKAVNKLFFWKRDTVLYSGVRGVIKVFVFGTCFTNKKWILHNKQIGKAKNMGSARKALEDDVNCVDISQNGSVIFDTDDAFLSFIRGLIIQTIPEIFFQIDFNPANNGSRSVQYFFTSTSQWADDAFKHAVACAGSKKLVIHQHGGTYGTMSPPIHQERHEIDIADMYLSWGWTNNRDNIIRFVRGFKPANVTERVASPIDAVRLILTRIKPFSRGDVFDITSWNNAYLKSVIGLSNSLHANHNLAVTLRMHPTQSLIYDIRRYLDRHIQSFSYDEGSITGQTGRIDIVTQNSTVLLDYIYQDALFLLYSPTAFERLNTETSSHFEALLSAKILHLTKESLEAHIASIKTSHAQKLWWSSPSVRAAISQFKSHFINDKLLDLRNALCEFNRL